MRDGPEIQVRLLGTGTSTGVPIIGCTCRVCRSSDLRDNRLRCSCFVQAGGVSILIDVGPDHRAQAIRFGIDKVDAVLITHHHFDHVVGLDDLRPYFFLNNRPIPCFAPSATADVLHRMFDYIFQDGTYPGVPQLALIPVEGTFDVASRSDPSASVPVTAIPVDHGDMCINGYRIGNFAYLTDTSSVPDASLEMLSGLDVLVLDALRHQPHPKHFTIEEAVETAKKIGADQTYFIHMTHSVLHAEEDARLPQSMALGYDGLSFSVSG